MHSRHARTRTASFHRRIFTLGVHQCDQIVGKVFFARMDFLPIMRQRLKKALTTFGWRPAPQAAPCDINLLIKVVPSRNGIVFHQWGRLICSECRSSSIGNGVENSRAESTLRIKRVIIIYEIKMNIYDNF